MKLSQLMLVGAVALLLVPVATAQTEPSPEDELLRELRAMRTRLSDMEARLTQAQAEYQQTITELKQELEELKAAQSPGAAQTGEEELDALVGSMATEPEETVPTGTRNTSMGRAIQNFNPEISVNADFVGHYSSTEGGGLDDEFLFRHFELGLSGNVDPYTRADIVVGIGKHDSEWHTHLEEAYLTYLGLPHDLQLRAGRFKSTFGRANPQHMHALPWVEYPIVIQNYFGDEGLSGDGVGISWLVPNPKDQFIELTYEVINNDSALFAGSETDDFVHLLHIKDFFDLSQTSTLEVGATLATAPNDGGHGGNRTHVEGLDITYKWRPLTGGLYKSLLWQTEFLSAQADLQGGRECTWGMYSGLDYQFARRFSAGLRYDYSQLPHSSSRHEHGYSAYLTFLQSEFAYWRLGYMYTDRNFRRHGDKGEHEVFLQGNFNLGVHPAHDY